MGFQAPSENNQRVVYLAVKYQKLIQPLPEFEDGCSTIEVKDPTTGQSKTKYYRAFAGVEGMVSKLLWYENTIKSTNKTLRGYKLYLDVDDSDSPTGFTTAVLDLPVQSVVYNTFTKVAENIDPDKPLTISVWVNKEQKPVVSFKQSGQPVKYKYTKDNMGDCPNGVRNEALGTWNFDAQTIFLKNRIDTVVVPKFNAKSAVPVSGGYSNENDGYGSNPDEYGDTSFPTDLTTLEY